MSPSPRPRKGAEAKVTVETLKREVTRLKASLMLHDRMGRLQLGTARQWQSIFDALSFPMALMDADGHIVQANRAMTEFTGQSCLDMVGSACWSTMHNCGSRIEDCLFLTMKKKGRSVTAEREGCGCRVTVCLDPLFDEKGRLAGAVHTIMASTPLNGGRRKPRKASAKK